MATRHQLECQQGICAPNLHRHSCPLSRFFRTRYTFISHFFESKPKNQTLVNAQVLSRRLHICCPNSPHLHHLHAQKHEGTVDVKTWQENSETGSEMNYVFFQIWEKSDFIIFSHYLWVLLPMACDAWAWIRDGHAPIFTVRYCPPCTVSIGIGSVPPFSPPHWDKIPTLTKDLFWWLLSCANICKYVHYLFHSAFPATAWPSLIQTLFIVDL